jgi:hypothetical protein
MQNISLPLAARYASLSSDKKHKFLLTTIFNLTISNRALLCEFNADTASQSRAINELLHKLSSHALATYEARDRYPDDVFFDILTEIASSAEITDAYLAVVLQSLERAEN